MLRIQHRRDRRSRCLQQPSRRHLLILLTLLGAEADRHRREVAASVVFVTAEEE
jgi:hypothetical protein